MGLQVCLFINTYGSVAYRDSGYPTSDGVIPFKLFSGMMECINRVKAFNIISDVQAVALGNAQVTADDKGQRKVKSIMNDFRKIAFGEE